MKATIAMLAAALMIIGLAVGCSRSNTRSRINDNPLQIASTIQQQ